MKTHLKYIEGTSDKFWQIEVQGKSFTVVYGKNGTSGTSQSKAFDSEEECLSAAEKLVAEKKKKGYSEDGSVNVEVKTSASTSKTPKSPNERELVIGEFNQIIRSSQKSKIIPFLKEKSKGNIEALVKEIKKAKRYWMTYVDLSKEPEFMPKTKHNSYHWGYRGNEEQQRIIKLAALGLFDKSDITSWDELVHLLNQINDPQVMEILQWAKPNWINAFLLDKAKKEWLVEYRSLRAMEDAQLITFDTELFALSLSRFNESRYDSKTKEKAEAVIDTLLNDDMIIQRDVKELFNYQTNIHNQTLYYHANGNNYGGQISTWEVFFIKALSNQKIDRAFFIENTLQIQTKEWNNNLKAFFRKRVEELSPSPEELVVFQETIFTFLHSPYPPITSYGVDLIKTIFEQKDFNIASFLEWLSPMMMRADCKSSIKVVLSILEKIAKANPQFVGDIANVIAEVFLIPDMSTQERAVKVIQKLGKIENVDFVDKLAMYNNQMQGNIRHLLKDYLSGVSDDMNEYEETLDYQYIPSKQALLTSPVIVPDTWNDLLFLFGQFISSEDPIDAELLLNAFVTQQHLFPEDFVEQLQPYLKQLERKYFESLYKNEIKAFLLFKINSGLKEKYENKNNYYNTIHTLQHIKTLTHLADEKIRNNSFLPLLSLPSHAPYFISPQVLVERILAYQEQNETINSLDFSIAIARTVRDETTADTLSLDKIDPSFRPLLAYCFGWTNEIKLEKEETSLLGKIKTILNGTAPNAEYTALWAVAARTFYPEATFPVFENTYLKEVPFVMSPFRPNFYFKEQWNEWRNYQTKQMERSASWYELHFDVPQAIKIPNNLIYSYIVRGKNRWEGSLGSIENTNYWHSIMPQNVEPLAFQLLATACTHADYSAAELKGFLQIMQRPEFVFSAPSALVFACCFFQEKKDLRLMATEVLIQKIEENAIQLDMFSEKLAFLINKKYGVLLRCIDALVAIKDVSNLHNFALFLILEETFAKLTIKEKLPTNFKKLVEQYIDLKTKTKQQASKQTKAFFEQWKENSALKALVKQIIND